MSENQTLQSPAEMRSNLSSFLTCQVDNPEMCWPRIVPAPIRRVTCSSAANTVAGMEVLVVGELTFEVQVEVEVTRAQLAASLRGKSTRRKLRLKVLGTEVGGFVAHATRAAAALGASVSVCTVAPVPLPDRFESFLMGSVVKRRFVAGLPGPSPITILFLCRDGRMTIRQRSMVSAGGLNGPSASQVQFDAVLVDPRHIAGHASIIRRLSSWRERIAGSVPTGLYIDQRCSPTDLDSARRRKVWTFVRGDDAREMKRHAGFDKRSTPGEIDEDRLVKWLRHKYGIAKLVTSLGSRGALLANGIPLPYLVHTCAVDRRNRASCGDTLLTVTTLSSASGVDDKVSLCRGVAAATGHAAGLDLPVCFEELDVA